MRPTNRIDTPASALGTRLPVGLNSLIAKGPKTGEIEAQLAEVHSTNISGEISKLAHRVLGELAVLQHRPLGRIGVSVNGQQNILGLWSHRWSVHQTRATCSRSLEIKNRGVDDFGIVVCNVLKGCLSRSRRPRRWSFTDASGHASELESM